MIIRWESLRGLGNSKIVKSNYIWLFLIPILVKNTALFNSILGSNVEVPFSVSRLFYTSIFFSIGSLIYFFYCPKIIQDHENYSDFLSKGKLTQHVIDYFQSTVTKFMPPITYSKIKDVISVFDSENINTTEKLIVTMRNSKGIVESLYIDKEREVEVFWEVYKKVNLFHPYALIFSAISFFIGFIFLFMLTVENFIFALDRFLF